MLIYLLVFLFISNAVTIRREKSILFSRIVIISSLNFDDILGQIYPIYIIAIAGAESAIGLSIFAAFYRLRREKSILFSRIVIISSLNFDDILGQIYPIYIIAIAGAESAIGLSIFAAFYRLRGSVAIEFK